MGVGLASRRVCFKRVGCGSKRYLRPFFHVFEIVIIGDATRLVQSDSCAGHYLIRGSLSVHREQSKHLTSLHAQLCPPVFLPKDKFAQVELLGQR